VKVQVATEVAQVREAIAELSRQSRGPSAAVGLVPTMGALHAGHASLIQAARRETGVVVVSLFVNPTQFGPNEDLARYPRTWESDVEICEFEGADLIFAPSTPVVYPVGFQTFVEVNELEKVLCGASRPGHFRGVATVVLKLFNIVRPDIAYFGQKDAQQARIIQQMVKDLNVPVKIALCPIVRAPDGLALSSRNRYLDAEQRQRATVLYRALELTRSRIAAGERSASKVTGDMAALVKATAGADLDYVAAVDWKDLQPLECLRGEVLLALAVRFGGTRLIDNVLLHVD
jgi:pantoate--beta-alanine ligase